MTSHHLIFILFALISLIMKYRLSAPCRGSNTFDAIPEGEVELGQDRMVSIFTALGYEIKVRSDVLVIGKRGDVEVALYRRGKAIIKYVKEKEEAEAIASSIFRLI